MTVLLGKSLRIWPGRASVLMSKSLGCLAEVEVADAAADEIAGKTGGVELFQDMEGVVIDRLERDRMLLLREDTRGEIDRSAGRLGRTVGGWGHRR